MCLFHPLLFPAVGFQNYWLQVTGFFQASSPRSADSLVSLSSPSGCKEDSPGGKRLTVTAKAEQFSWRGAGVGMAPVGQSPRGFHGEREPLSLIWLMSSTLPNDPCARLQPLQCHHHSSCSAALQQNLTWSWVKQGDCIVRCGVT